MKAGAYMFCCHCYVITVLFKFWLSRFQGLSAVLMLIRDCTMWAYMYKQNCCFMFLVQWIKHTDSAIILVTAGRGWAMSSRRKGHGNVGTTSPISSHMIQKVGINGVTLVPKPTTADKEHPTFALPSSRRPLKHHSPGIVHRTLWNSTFTLTKFISLSHTLIITVFI